MGPRRPSREVLVAQEAEVRQPRLSGAGQPLVSWPALLGAGFLAVATFTVFGALPDLDLAVARAFYLGDGHFAGQGALGTALREGLYWIPAAVMAGLALSWAAARFGWRVGWAPDTRGLTVAALSLALGPGLLVNVVLKDHSHRPRPVQVREFGGFDEFRPVGRFDGGCRRNCSFVSGEGAAGFWTLAAALLAPAVVQPACLVAALAFGTAVAILRMATGGHFLSDTILAGLFTWLIIGLVWRAVMPRSPPPAA